MGMKYVCLVDGGIKDVEACRDMIVEGVRGLVEEARAVAGKDVRIDEARSDERRLERSYSKISTRSSNKHEQHLPLVASFIAGGTRRGDEGGGMDWEYLLWNAGFS